MEIGDQNIIPNVDLATFYSSDADPSHIVIIVYGGDEHLHRTFLVTCRAVDIVLDRLKQRLQIDTFHIRAVTGSACSAGAEKHRAVELFVGGPEIHEKLKDLIDDFCDTSIGAIHLIDHDDEHQAELQRSGENESRLRHGTFCRVHKEENTVCHLQNAFHLAAEIGVSGRVDDVDLDVFIHTGAVFGEDRNASLALQITAVHDAVLDDLVLTERTALAEHLVDQRRLAVVNVSDDRDVS